MKMCCQEAADMFYDYLDKELSPEDIRQLEDHLRQCRDCVGHVEFDKAARLFMKRRLGQLNLSSDVKEAIFSKLGD